MKLNYFLRGLGAGIVFSVAILNVSNRVSGADTMTDSEIIERARQLGMVDKEEAINESLERFMKSQEESQKSQDQQDQEPDNSQEGSEGKEDPKADEENGSEKAGEVSDSDSPAQKDAEAEDSEKDEAKPEEAEKDKELGDSEKEKGAKTVFKINIAPGMSSRQITEALEEIGLVDDAKDFEAYLIDNGYSTKIRAGSYTIEGKLSYEELAKRIAE